MAIEGRHEEKFLSAFGFPLLTRANLDLFQRLKTVRYKSGAQDGNFFDALFCEFIEPYISVRGDPRCASQS